MIYKLLMAARRVGADYTIHGIPGRLVGDPCKTVLAVETDTEAFAELAGAAADYFAGGRSPSSCRFCRAPIVWVKTEAGKNAPLDACPIEGIDADGKHRRIHLSHFITCPHAEKVRAEKAAAAELAAGQDGKTKAAQ